MADPDLNEIMSLYAKRGLADWLKADPSLQERARECLKNRIAENDYHVSATLKRGQDSAKLMFIPMPEHPAKRGFEGCFFVPMQQTKDGALEVSFDLFFLVDEKRCLAFRIEPAHPGGETHDYGHVQMSRKLLQETLDAETLAWVPVSYPAFPTRTSDPVRMFLYMATAVHGRSEGVVTVIKEIFQSAQLSQHAPTYFDLLKEVLG